MHYEKEFEKLNEYQKEAVLDDSDACVINANVGSGKTTVLISKILYLHYEKHVSYKDMIVLTFTNKAANEIKERLMESDNSVKAEELECFGTFHSVALYLLKNILSVEKIGYTKDFIVIDPEEEIDIALQIIQEEKLTIKYKNRLKKRLEQAMSINKEEEKVSRYDDDIFKLVDRVKEEKNKQNKMTFSDLLKNANYLLDGYNIGARWIIIDEVQDCDKLQLDFIDKLKEADTKLFAVGDPNQVIYSWRGSAFNVFYILRNKYGAKELSLPINYRSSSSILEVAKYFWEGGESLEGIRDIGNKIIVKSHYNSFNEASYISDKIKEIHESGVPYNEIAIFYRLQEQSKVLEDVFSKSCIPYEVSQKKNVGDVPVLNWVIKLLRFSLNSKDFSSGIYVLSHKEYGERIKEKEARKILTESTLFITNLLDKMNEFVSKANNISSANEIYDYFEFDKYIRPTASTYEEDRTLIYNLLNIIVEYVNENKMSFVDGLREFINSSSLYGINVLKKDIKGSEDSVKLMTLHASKGLEFSYVFITGVNYGLIPLHTKDKDEDEERRLFFVGITRAKDYLELSYYTNPDIYGSMPGASRYITVIPEKLIESDTIKNENVNLQELKKQIQQVKNEKIEEEVTLDQPANEVIEKQVKHKKYGNGKVLKEDDMMIEVEFENYGIKEFIKAFSELEFL